MNEKLEAIKQLIEQLSKEEQQTPFFHVAIGGLRTAAENLPEHMKAIERQAAATAKASLPSPPPAIE